VRDFLIIVSPDPHTVQFVMFIVVVTESNCSASKSGVQEFLFKNIRLYQIFPVHLGKQRNLPQSKEYKFR
jgi:hypothetical protein